MKPVLAVIVAGVATLGPSVRAASARPAQGAITSIGVAPAPGRADMVVSVDGKVRVTEFTLKGPDRIVVDVEGATLDVAPSGYDHVVRGGVTDVRYSQFRRGTVRVVVYLDRTRAYKVSRTAREIRVAVTTEPGAQFAAWHVGAGEPRTAATTPAAPANKAPAPAAADFIPGAPTVAETPASDMPVALAAKSPLPPPRVERPVRRDDDVEAAADADSDAAAAAPKPAARRPAPQAPQRSQQSRITVTYQGSDIRDVLAAFAAFSRRTIIPASGVPAVKVDAEIRDQPWDVALQAILSAQGLAASEDANGIIIVDTQERIAARAQTEPLVTRIVRLNYQRATEIGDQLRQRLLQCIPSERSGGSASPSSTGAGQPPAPGAPANPSSSDHTGGNTACRGRGSVSADEATNSVSITGPSSSIDDLVTFGETLDLRQPQVNIKAKIVLVNRTDLDALGIKYDLGSRHQFFNTLVQRSDSLGHSLSPSDPPTVLLGGNTVSAIANASGNVPGAALRLIYSTALGKFDFSTFLDALQEVSLLDVQAEPSVTTINNRTAELISGAQVPFVPLVSSGGSGTSLTGPITVERIQTGVTLRVTPSVTNNRQIMMHVEVVNSDVNFTNNGTLIDNNNTKSDLLVADGQTVVIGGLTQTSVRVTKSGLPLLVDLPLIGRLFGYTTRQEQRRDLLVLITPHIIDEQQPLEARR